MNIDQAKEKFDQLYIELTQENLPIETEQETRFQIIDRVLMEILGWERAEIRMEPHTDSGYIDYLITSGGCNRLVVEAKRTSTSLINTQQKDMAWYKVSGPALKFAAEGLEQAKRYCTDTAVLFSALTTGYSWVAFWAVRTDNKPPSEGKAAAFPNLESIQQNFATFYDLFSKEGVLKNLYQVHVHEAEGLQTYNYESLDSVITLHERRLLEKTSFSTDLENAYRSFFSNISGEDDPDMLAKCFVESKESRVADESLKKITQNLLNRIDTFNSGEGTELENQIRDSVKRQRGEFVLVIGSKGAGKSTFIDRFFRLVINKDLRNCCLVLKLDLANSSGDQNAIASWLTDNLKQELENNLFKEKIPSYEELQGVFIQEYDRWRNGERKHLYQKNKNEFKEKFGEWMADLIEKQPEKYVTRLIENATKARKLMPCIVFDNTDHFPQTFQEAVFQYAQSIYRTVFSFIICPITDRTIWQLSKSGPLQSYNHRAFYLPIPSTKEVLSKRVEFIKEKTKEDSSANKEYFTQKGLRLTVPDIKAFALSIEDIFLNEDYVGRTIGYLSNHDIRRSLLIAQRIITSPTIGITELVSAYVAGNKSRPTLRKIKKALFCGEYNHFYQAESDYILNLFEVSPNSMTSPLLRLSILRFLLDAHSEVGTENTYRTVEDILNYFEPATVNRSLVKQHLKVLLEYRLIEPYDPTDNCIYESQRVNITYSGIIHCEFIFDDRKEASYMSEMALMTPVRSQQYINYVRSLLNDTKLEWKDWKDIIQCFVEYCMHEDKLYLQLPQTRSYENQRNLRKRLLSTWDVSS
jgi:energy-coupling factor transporter ATP-binding protein EcfA2